MRHEGTGRFHVAFFQEHSFPGPYEPAEEVKAVRLISHSHHTEGADSLKEAFAQRAETAASLNVPPTNLFDEVVSWDGSHGVVLIYPNWLKVSPALVF